MKTKQNTSKGQKNQKTDDFYEVEHIISKKLEDGVAKYLVKWHGYNEEDSKLFFSLLKHYFVTNRHLGTIRKFNWSDGFSRRF